MYCLLKLSAWTLLLRTKYLQSKMISNDQDLIQSDPTSCPQNLHGWELGVTTKLDHNLQHITVIINS